MRYGKLIKKALEEKKMTQKELAETLYVTPQAVSKWLNGESRPSQDNALPYSGNLKVITSNGNIFVIMY